MRPTPGPANAPGKRMSVVLAVAVHLVLAALLIYGIHWQTKVNNVVEVELVRQMTAPQPVAKPEPRVEPEPKIEPKVEPKPAPKAEPPKPRKPDIAIKEKPKPKPKEEPKPAFDPFRQQMAQEEQRLTTQKQIADEEKQLAQRQQAQAANARNKALATYSDRIRAKIRGNIVLPPELKGNPTAVFDVVQLPSGEVISARLAKTSGYTAYDDAVERAIWKSSPLPRPDDPSLFERSLRLTFCPREDGKCG
jgi:colicin import membrane protein